MTTPQTPSSYADAVFGELGMQYADTETGNMLRFVDQHRDRLKFIPERHCWAIWDGNRWAPCHHSQVFELALETAKGIYDEARDCEKEEGRKRLTSWALRSQAKRHLNGMIDMAARNPKLIAHLHEFDTDPLKINCENGLVDLRTGELVKQQPSDLLMKAVPVDFKRHAQCPVFNEFLRNVFNGDGELIGWLQRAIGYTLTGKTSEQVLFIAHGSGSNGKSTLFETILDLLGDYGRAAEFDTFLATDQSSVRVMEGIGKLRGIRFALASETDRSRKFSEALVKRVTGGDTITGAQLHKASFEFRPEFKLWLLANHLPRVADESHGFWRRARVVPFARKFTTAEIDQTLREKLLDEAEGIFAWCVRGAMNWLKQIEESGGQGGLGTCSAIEDATNTYRSDNSALAEFFASCLEDAPGSEVSASDINAAYQQWCAVAGSRTPVSQAVLGSSLSERGYTKKRKRDGIVYVDVALKASSSAPPPAVPEPGSSADF